MIEIVRFIGKCFLLVLFIVFAQYINLKSRQNEIKNSSINEKQLLEKKIYTLEYGMGLKIIGVLCLLVGSLFWINDIGNVFFEVGYGIGSDTVTLIGFSILEFASLCVFLLTCMWRVKVNNNEIEYRNYIGITKHYKLEDVFIVSKRDGEVVVFQNYKKIFTVGLLVKNKHVFLMHIAEKSAESVKNM